MPIGDIAKLFRQAGPSQAIRLLRELVETGEMLLATHLSFPCVCDVKVEGDVFRCMPDQLGTTDRLLSQGRTRACIHHEFTP